ncbi:MAG: hypothetical protein SGARI_004363, partial [Bacillariaceae sp.]
MHWSQSGGEDNNSSMSMEEAIMNGVNVKKTNIFSKPTNHLLFNFSLYVEEALKNQFPSMRDKATNLVSLLNNASDTNSGNASMVAQALLDDDDAQTLKLPISLMACLF